VLSHRGTKTYSVKSLELAKKSNSLGILVTGLDSKADMDLAKFVLRTSTQEQTATFTVSHTTCIIVLLLLALELAKHSGMEHVELHSYIQKLPQITEHILKKEDVVKRWAESIKNSSNIYILGWGPNTSTAYEAALKIKEANYTITEGFQVEQFLHGSFAAIHDSTALIFVSPPGSGYERTEQILRASKQVGGKVSAIVEEDSLVSKLLGSESVVEVPKIPLELSPIIYLLPLQMLTYFLSLEKKKRIQILVENMMQDG